MNLEIEIPDAVDYDIVSLDDAFDHVSNKKEIKKENLYNIYKKCKTENDFLFLNKHGLFSIDEKTVKKGDKFLYTKNNINKHVTIMDIHHDDYPNTYYTIKFEDTLQEKQTISEHLKIIEYFDIELSQKKRKREFASYENKNNFFVAACKFLYCEDDNNFTKIYIFEDDFKKHVIVAKIMCEIYFQQYANIFNTPNKCNFLVPKIYNYGYVNTNKYDNQLVFYFTMENTKSIPLNKICNLKLNDTIDYVTKYNELKYKAIGINKCLKCNGFYHNDLHSNNIMINDKNDEIFIIDYGESSKKDDNLLGFQDHKYCIDCDHEKKYCRMFF